MPVPRSAFSYDMRIDLFTTPPREHALASHVRFLYIKITTFPHGLGYYYYTYIYIYTRPICIITIPELSADSAPTFRRLLQDNAKAHHTESEA